ncbi:hypothetical protein KTO58_21255 [Chitinophaga pendula]|uniref:hypothetical protein n=1 Tax=Chitinophaga TaxID=79328 RepID=UPI000BAF24DB|nr:MULTISPECIES: hypothetical protein [Chitinophaga]ASZ10842.1 hypothetical protein CK934_07550 [Chitinophaga sp. MD30]UCJ06178.1 hypothetical protein KTO58_21255 [Chitinophaga pendula]
MKKLTCYLFGILFSVITILQLQSCQKNDKPLPQNKTALTIDEAKQYFKAGINSKVSPESTPLTYFEKEPSWDRAYTKHTNIGNVVAVPLNFTNSDYFSTNKLNTKTALSDYSYLLISKDAIGQIHNEVVLVLPSDKYLDNNDKHFSGVILIQEWRGKIIRGYRFNDGQYTLIPNIGIRKKGPVLTEKYEPCFLEADHYTCNNFGGITECFYDYTVSIPCGNGGGGIKQTFAKVSNEKLSNNINVFLQELHDDKKYKFTFYDVYPEGTVESPSRTYPQFDDKYQYTGSNIRFSGNIVSTFSQELQVQLMHHEILHAWLSRQPNPDRDDHITMINSMLKFLVNADREIFPNYPIKDAYANAMFGLTRLLNFEDSAELFQEKLKELNLTLDECKSTYKKYSVGDNNIKLGTRCQ